MPDPYGGVPAHETQAVNFILLGHQRSGSNLLARALVEHPQIRMMAEVLSPDERTRATSAEWILPRREPYKIGDDGGRFIEHMVFAPAPEGNLRAFGCKLFYEDARFDEFSRTAWDYILSHDIRIIHLIRRNLFDTLISLEVAQRTERWLHRIEQQTAKFAAVPPFTLDPVACQAYFERITAWRTWAQQTLARHKVFNIEYETGLSTNFRSTALQVFEFLETMSWHSRPGLIKQQTIPAFRQIANFDELRRFFRDTAYAAFFENTDSPPGHA